MIKPELPMINLFNENITYLPQISKSSLGDDQVLDKIWEMKKELGNDLYILGHHYQHDDVIQYADVRGDSLFLAKEASKLDHPNIVFCGVHFMAEAADILTSKKQSVILPDTNAGCSMADMANTVEVEKAWDVITTATNEKIIPITYVNCSAELKAFVGKNGGSICTSSNAKKIISWALENGEKLLFFPDQHLGRNTCFDLDVPLNKMVTYNPLLPAGGLTNKQIQNAQVILWYGYCSVHQGFTPQHIKEVKEKDSDMKVIVHPECTFDVVQNSDLNGSTSYIINVIRDAPAGSKFAVGTEINLVNRLAKTYTDKKIISLAPYQCICPTMYRIRPRWLLQSLISIKNKKPINVIKIDDEIKKYANIALEKMLSI